MAHSYPYWYFWQKPLKRSEKSRLRKETKKMDRQSGLRCKIHNNKKECIVAFVEFVACAYLTVLFLVFTSLSLIFGDWLIAILCSILCVISAYCAIKGLWRYFDLTDGEYGEDDG